MYSSEVSPGITISSARLQRFANTVRGLAIDAVQNANSGHPGLPMGAADVAAVLWSKFLKFNPADPNWADRDRFVLSGGHGSMLLYALLHLTGFDLSLDDLKSFRQLHSKTPGHPEYGHTPGVEITTGPLGQGLASAVGMAIAERRLAEKYNRPDFTLIDHYTYVLAGDGDLMEGISHEACSLAGHLGLNKLIVLYDDNDISIDGSTALAFSESVPARFAAYGWNILKIDGHNMLEIESALAAARKSEKKPTLICCKTVIGYGSPNRAGTAKAHGEPLGPEEARLSKRRLGIPEYWPFHVPADVAEIAAECRTTGAMLQSQWEALCARYGEKYPDLLSAMQAELSGAWGKKWQRALPRFSAGTALATRAASGKVLNQLAGKIPGLVGGSADLSGSNNTLPENEKGITSRDFTHRYVHYGVREHAMGAIMNGLALHGGHLPYGGTFLVFSDYMRGSIRLAALMGLQVIYIFTHDSIGLGEDGPTHQPVEQLAGLRAMPNLTVLRPADANETVAAWKVALENRSGPTALVLSRQKVPVLSQTGTGKAEVVRGGYILSDSDETPQVILIATGSEVHIAVAAQEMLKTEGIAARVVSMPSTELFERQSQAYRDQVLPPHVRARVVIEAAATCCWGKYAGDAGVVIGLDRFGASAPYQELYQEFGFTAEHIAAEARALCGSQKTSARNGVHRQAKATA